MFARVCTAERVPRDPYVGASGHGEQLRASSSLGRSPRANDCIGPTGLSSLDRWNLCPFCVFRCLFVSTRDSVECKRIEEMEKRLMEKGLESERFHHSIWSEFWETLSGFHLVSFFLPSEVKDKTKGFKISKVARTDGLLLSSDSFESLKGSSIAEGSRFRGLHPRQRRGNIEVANTGY